MGDSHDAILSPGCESVAGIRAGTARALRQFAQELREGLGVGGGKCGRVGADPHLPARTYTAAVPTRGLHRCSRTCAVTGGFLGQLALLQPEAAVRLVGERRGRA